MNNASTTSEHPSEPEAVEPVKTTSTKAVNDQPINKPESHTQTETLRPTDENALTQQPTKQPLKPPQNNETTDHLSDHEHNPTANNGDNPRNDTHPKTVLPDVNPVENEAPPTTTTTPLTRRTSTNNRNNFSSSQQKQLTDVNKMMIRTAGPSCEQDAFAKEIEDSAAEHLTLQHLKNYVESVRGDHASPVQPRTWEMA